MKEICTISDFQKISNAFYKLTGARVYFNRVGNIHLDASPRFRFVVYNDGTIEKPQFFMRKRNISNDCEYNACWLLDRNSRTGKRNFYSSVDELIQFFTKYVNGDTNRLSKRYYDFSFLSGRY